MVSPQPIAVDFANWRRQRRQLWLKASREIGALQPFEHLLPSEIVVHLVVERQDDVGKTELRVREHSNRVGESAEVDLQRNRDLLFDFFGCVPGHKRNNRHLHVCHIGERFDGQ